MHQRPPESALFEDSPDAQQRAPHMQVNRELNFYPRAPDSQFHPISQPPATSYQRGYPEPHPQPYLPQRFNQSEESGGVIHSSEGVGGGMNEDYDDPQMEEMREGDNDIEYIIMNLYSKMKNLENKYIDLANFYKQELVKSTHREDSTYPNRPGGNLISPSKSFDRSPEMDQSPGKDSPKRQDMQSERQIINDLIEEKKRLEDDMKHMMALKAGISYNQQQLQQSPSKAISDFKTNIPNKEQFRFLNEQLNEALNEVIENLEGTQRKELQYLSQKQNEMYQLASRYNLQSQVKNESLGLWYDAKTKVASLMSDLKSQVQNKQKQIEQNLISSKINTERQENTQESEESKQSTLSSKVLDDFRIQITNIKKKQDIYQKNVQKLKSALKFKDGIIKEEQTKLQMILRDLKQSVSSGDDYNRRLLSGEKGQNPLLMSPFERKIATYQKSAELRKSTQERSGSRGRAGIPMSNTGSNFYQYKGELSNPQIMQNQNDQDLEMRSIKQKVKQFELSLEDFYGKLSVKTQDHHDLERLTDTQSLEINKFLAFIDNQINYQAQLTKQQRGRSSNKDHLTISPVASNQNYHSNKDQDKKISDLLRSNDQIYQELRKANEKYLNQRVDNNRLKDEIQILQNSLDDANTQIRKLQSSSTIDSTSKQQVRLKSRTNRHDPNNHSQNISSQGPGQRNSSNTSNQLSRENEDLKKRIRELEKECYSLTYYQQEMQRRGQANDPYARSLNQENQELKNKMESLCLQVQKFMLAMRRLQRAVNNKDKDIQDLKADFEKNKKVLDSMVKEIKEKEEQKKQQGINNNSLGAAGVGPSTHHSMMMSSWDKRDPRFTSEERTNLSAAQARNRSQNPTSSTHNLNQRSQLYPVTQRPQDDTHSNTSMSMLPPKKGQIRPKAPQAMFSANSNKFMENSDYNNHSQQEFSQQPQFTEQEQFNNLLEEVKTISEESERLKKQIEDLKSSNEQLNADKNSMEVKMDQKQINLQKVLAQMKTLQERNIKCEKLVSDYKEALHGLESNSQISQLLVSKIKTDLLYKERDLVTTEPTTIPQGFGKTSFSTQTDQRFQMISDQLKHELVEKIKLKEIELEQQLEDMHLKLSEKEEDLQKVKKLLVDKLRELESSFVELSQDMIESEQVQQEASRRYQAKQQKTVRQNSDLEKSIEQVIGKIDDDQDQQIEQLAQMNEELLEECNELRSQVKLLQKELNKTSEVDILKNELQELQEQNLSYQEHIDSLKENSTQDKKQLDLFKKQTDRLRNELAESNKAREKAADNYQRQLNEAETLLMDKNQQLSQEQEQRIFFESEYNLQDKAVKRMRAEKLSSDDQREKLLKRESELMTQIESLKQEIEYMNSLRQGETSVELEGQEISEEVDQARIEANPKEAASHYLRLMKATQKEYKIMASNNVKLEQKNEELKEKLSDLKKESRETVQELMNMENQLFELQNTNEKLKQEIDRTKGQFQVDEEEVRRQLAIEFKERLDYKETEIEAAANKLSRITQSNIELTSKCVRLESCNQELSSELEQIRNKLSTTEMELEMTKLNTERDAEQLIDQQKSLESEKQALMERISKKKDKMLTLKQSQQEAKSTLAVQQQQELINLEAKYNAVIIDEQLRSKQTLDQEMIQQAHHHQQEKEKLEARLKEEISSQESRLKESEQEKLARIRKEMEQEHQEQLAQKQLAFQQQKQYELEQLQESLSQHMKAQSTKADKEKRLLVCLQMHVRRVLEQELQSQIQSTQDNQAQLQAQMEQAQQEVARKERERKLVVKLQMQVQKMLEKEVSEAAQAMSARETQIKELQKQLQAKASVEDSLQQTLNEKQQRDQELHQLQNQYQDELQQLESHSKAQLMTVQDKAQQELKSTLSQKDKERKLIMCLQMHVKSQLEKELQNTLSDLQAQNHSITQLHSQLEAKSQQEQQLTADYEQMQLDYQEELQQLEDLKQEELRVLEQRMRLEQQDKEKRIKKERSLIEVLQSKARDAILRQLEEEKIKRQQEHEESKKQLDGILTNKEKEMDQLRETSQIKLQTLKHQLEQQSQESYQRQQSEIERLQQEQQELVLSLSERQDKQTQDLLTQKERERQALKEELERQIEEMKKDVQKRIREGKLVMVLQEKVKRILEGELQQAVAQREQEKLLKEQELQKMKDEAQKMLNNHQSRSKEEQDRLRHDLEEKQRIFEDQLEAKEAEVRKAKSDQDKILEQLNKKKQDELTKVQDKLREQMEEMASLKDSEISDLKDQISDKEEIIQKCKDKVTQLTNQIKDLKTNHQQEQAVLKQQVQELDDEYQSQIQALQREHQDQVQSMTVIIDNLKQQHQSQLKQKEQDLSARRLNHEQSVSKLEEEHQEQLETLQLRLEEEQQQLLAKKDQEKTVLQKQLEQVKTDKDTLIANLQEQVKALEQELGAKEQDIERERSEQLDMIKELNQKVDEQAKVGDILDKTTKDLELLKRSQSESDNQQIKTLSEKAQALEKQRDELLVEKKVSDQELQSLKQQLQEKVKEIDAQGQDLESLYKEMEENQLKYEGEKLDIKQRMKEVQKEKNQNELQLKLKEGILKKLEEEVAQQEEEMQDKQVKLLEQIHEKEREAIRNGELENQIKQLKEKHAQELESLQKELQEAKPQVQDLNHSIDDIENRLGEFNVQLTHLKQEQKNAQQLKRLSDSLIENAENDKCSEVLEELGSDQLQYCKRVKYLEKAWILITKQDAYYWVDQEKIPLDRIKKIKVQEIDDNQDTLQKKLAELQRDKEVLVKLIQKKGSVSDSQVNDDYLQLKGLEIENAQIKQELNELKLHNNSLQQVTVQYKTKISELQDIIFKLTETDKSNDTLNMMVTQNQDMKNKYLEQIDANRRLENENELLKKQLTEMDYSFARGQKSFAQMKPENFDMLNASSIEQEENESINAEVLPTFGGEKALKDKVSKLETELEEFRLLAEALQSQNNTLKGENKEMKNSQSNVGEKQQHADEVMENIKHAKILFIQFLESVPVVSKKEDLLPVIFSMMNMSREEIVSLQKSRTSVSEKSIKESVNKGVLGGFFGKPKR